MVVGSCGDYFAVADTVIMMDSYRVKDVSSEALELCNGVRGRSSTELDAPNLRPDARFVDTASLTPSAPKVQVRDIRKIFYGSEEHAIDMSSMEQKVELGQIVLIADVMKMLSRDKRDVQISTMIDNLLARMDEEGLDIASSPDRPCNGSYVRMRKFELAAAINRWRKARMGQP